MGRRTHDCHLPQGQICQEGPQAQELDQALKGGYKPKGEKKDKEGKPKTYLWVSATKEEGFLAGLWPHLRDPAPVWTRESREMTPPGQTKARKRPRSTTSGTDPLL